LAGLLVLFFKIFQNQKIVGLGAAISKTLKKPSTAFMKEQIKNRQFLRPLFFLQIFENRGYMPEPAF